MSRYLFPSTKAFTGFYEPVFSASHRPLLPSSHISAFSLLILSRREVSQRRVKSFPVIEDLNVFEDRQTGCLAAPKCSISTQLTLQRLEERLCWCIVPAISSPAHALKESTSLDSSAKRMAAVLRASIRVKDHSFWRPTPHQSHHKCMQN